MNDDPSIEVAGGNNADSTAGGVTASFTQPENTGDAVPGAAGAVLGLITLSDPDMGDTHTVTVDDGRFQVIDHAGAKWLTLKAGQSLDFEEAASIDLTLTVEDNNGGTDSTAVTITVTDVNEAPTAAGELPTVIGTAGEALAGDQTRIDLGMFFSDPDGEDDLTYAASGGPDWFSFKVDEETGHGVLSGTPPTSGPNADALHTVTITATDKGGLSASRSFTLVVDDGNDPITGMEFTNAVGDRQITTDTVKVNLRTSIAENEKGAAGGTLLGTFGAVDPDSEEHPNGMITWSLPPGRWSSSFEIDPKSGEVRLKEGVELDFESVPFTPPIREIQLQVRATDGGDPKLSRTETLYIEVTNANDAPEADGAEISRGWWVTRDEDKESGDDQSDDEYVERGEWLTFGLETRPIDQRPAFSDVDLDTGDRLTYSLVGSSPAWLRIDAQTGVMENRAGMVADEDLYTVTVRATDTGGAATDFTFRLAVAVSDFENGGPAGSAANPDDNDDPEIDADAVDILENAPSGAVVATFTVEDEELPIGPVHPWGRVNVDVSSSWETGTRGDDPGYNDGVAQVGEDPVSGDYFSVHHTGTTGDTASYEVRLTLWGARVLDHESQNRDDVTFTIRAADGTFDADGDADGANVVDGSGDLARLVTAATHGADIDTVTVDIDDVNEAPEYKYTLADSAYSSPLHPPPSPLRTTFNVDQQEIGDGAVTRIYLNLTRMFEDPEDGDDDVTFTAALGGNAPWLTLLRAYNTDSERTMTGPQKWGHIKFGRDEAEGGEGRDADITWGAGSGGGTITAPDDDDIVLILSVDRGAIPPGSNAQDANGMITVTATDDDGKSNPVTFTVRVNDQNLPVPDAVASAGRVVTLSGPPREGNDLTARFNKLTDPDFTGDEADPNNPILVRYQWWTSERADPDSDGVLDDVPPTYLAAAKLRHETTENHEDMTGTAKYTVRQVDVGGKVEGRVIYYELFDGEIVQSQDVDSNTDGVQGFKSKQTSEIQNVPDAEKISFKVDTTSTPINGTTTHFLRITPSFPRQERDRAVNEDGNIEVVNARITGYDFDYAWEYSPNGKTGWTVIRDLDDAAVDKDENVKEPSEQQLELPASVEGGYVRLVVIYRDEGDPQGNQVEGRVNQVESEAVKVGKIMHLGDIHIDDSAGRPPQGVVPAGRKLQIDGLVDVPNGSSKVEWLIHSRVVGEGREYTVSASDRDAIIARVTRYDADGGLVSKTETTPVTPVMLTPNAAPILAQPEPHFVDLGKAPDADGKYAMLTGTINLQALFKDPEGDQIVGFGVTAPAGGFGESPIDEIMIGPLDLWHDLGTNQGGSASNDDVADGSPEGDQILLVNERTGEVEYHSTQAQDHGTNNGETPNAGEPGTDGNGNWISVNVTARDIFLNPVGADTPDNTNDNEAMVNLRIDAAPTGFMVSADISNKARDSAVADDNAANTDNLNADRSAPKIEDNQPTMFTKPYKYTVRDPYTVREHNSDNGEVVGMSGSVQTNARVIARIDVQDDNLPTHAYGQYTFSVNNDRFEVLAVRGDTSSGILRLKTKQSLDFEALNEGQPAKAGAVASINLVVTATPVKHSDGSDGHEPITLGISVNVINVDEKTDPNADDVPGLEDNESDNNNTNLDDAGSDEPAGSSTDSGSEVEGDDTDTTDDTDGDADGDHDGGWWSASDDGLF